MVEMGFHKKMRTGKVNAHITTLVKLSTIKNGPIHTNVKL